MPTELDIQKVVSKSAGKVDRFGARKASEVRRLHLLRLSRLKKHGAA